MVDVTNLAGGLGGIRPAEIGKEKTGAQGVSGAEGERSFKDILSESIENVNQLQKDADLSLEKLKDGEAKTEEVFVAFRKAQVAFESLMQIRNKLVDAFEEIQRMRI